MALVTTGRIDLMTGRVDEALERFERSLALASADREQLGIVIAQHHRGWARLIRGDPDGAAADFADGHDASLSPGHAEGIAYGPAGRARVAPARGQGEHAGLVRGPRPRPQ